MSLGYCRPGLPSPGCLFSSGLGSLSPRVYQHSAPWAAGHPELQDMSTLSDAWTHITSMCYRWEPERSAEGLQEPEASSPHSTGDSCCAARL